MKSGELLSEEVLYDAKGPYQKMWAPYCPKPIRECDPVPEQTMVHNADGTTECLEIVRLDLEFDKEREYLKLLNLQDELEEERELLNTLRKAYRDLKSGFNVLEQNLEI